MEQSGKSSLKILQVSDCHFSLDRNADYRGQNADRGLKCLLPAMRAWDPDLVLLTGDVSEDSSPASYARVAVMLETVGAPVLALPGNHDDPDVMQAHFPLGPWQGSLARERDRWLLLLMDSTERGKISGSFSQQELERLDELMRGSTAEFILIALHHQPVAVNSHWIDRYGLENPAVFLNFIERDNRVRCITWGHVHQDFQKQRRGVTLLGAPSTVANSLPEKERFTLDFAGPACRWLRLGADGSVETGLVLDRQHQPKNQVDDDAWKSRRAD